MCSNHSLAERRAVVLLSGGLDSAVTMALALEQGFEVLPLSVWYGQRHEKELVAAKAVASSLGVSEPAEIRVDLRGVGGSSLTSADPVSKAGLQTGIPATYVPARNMIFLSLAVAYAEAQNCRNIFVGVNALDNEGYPDCRPEFIAFFEATANLATKAGVSGGRIKIHTPLIRLSKTQIVKEGARLGVDLGLTWSCYDPQGDEHCGQCDSCRLRAEGFLAAGEIDPTGYARL